MLVFTDQFGLLSGTYRWDLCATIPAAGFNYYTEQFIFTGLLDFTDQFGLLFDAYLRVRGFTYYTEQFIFTGLLDFTDQFGLLFGAYRRVLCAATPAARVLLYWIIVFKL